MSCSKDSGLSVGPKRFTGTPSASQRNLRGDSIQFKHAGVVGRTIGIFATSRLTSSFPGECVPAQLVHTLRGSTCTHTSKNKKAQPSVSLFGCKQNQI